MRVKRLVRFAVAACFFGALACDWVQTEVTVVGEERGVRLEHRHHHGTRYVDGGMHSTCGWWQDVDQEEYVLLFDARPDERIDMSCEDMVGDVAFAVDESALRYAMRCGGSWTIYNHAVGFGLFHADAPEGFDGTEASWQNVRSRGDQAKISLREGNSSRAVIEVLRETSRVEVWTSLVAQVCGESSREDWYALGSLDAAETVALRKKLRAQQDAGADVTSCLKALRDPR